MLLQRTSLLQRYKPYCCKMCLTAVNYRNVSFVYRLGVRHCATTLISFLNIHSWLSEPSGLNCGRAGSVCRTQIEGDGWSEWGWGWGGARGSSLPSSASAGSSDRNSSLCDSYIKSARAQPCNPLHRSNAFPWMHAAKNLQNKAANPRDVV